MEMWNIITSASGGPLPVGDQFDHTLAELGSNFRLVELDFEIKTPSDRPADQNIELEPQSEAEPSPPANPSQAAEEQSAVVEQRAKPAAIKSDDKDDLGLDAPPKSLQGRVKATFVDDASKDYLTNLFREGRLAYFDSKSGGLAVKEGILERHNVWGPIKIDDKDGSSYIIAENQIVRLSTDVYTRLFTITSVRFNKKADTAKHSETTKEPAEGHQSSNDHRVNHSKMDELTQRFYLNIKGKITHIREHSSRSDKAEVSDRNVRTCSPPSFVGR